MNREYLITRKQYKEIKKMDRQQMESFLRNLLSKDTGLEKAHIKKETISLMNDFENAISITKGIGEKRKQEIFKNLEKIRSENID